MSELLGKLRRMKENRGMMADLRCYLIESKRHRAWPVLGRLGISLEDQERAVVAALFAIHPDESGKGNLGAACRLIHLKRDGGMAEDRLGPVERRFRHLLSADTLQECFERVTRLVLLAKAQGVPIDFDQLENDLVRWRKSERVRREWACAFWAPEPEKGGEA